MKLITACAIISLVIFDSYAEQVIRIGAILSTEAYKDMFLETIGNLTAPPGYLYQGFPLIAGSNPVVTANDICSTLLPEQVVTVLYDVAQDKDKFMSSVPFTLEFYKIPVVGISSRSSVLSNSYAHPQFMRTLPAYSFESKLWYDTLKKFGYNKVVFIYTNDIEGETTLNKFRNIILQSDTAYGEKSLEISKLVMLQPYEKNFTKDLQPILLEDSRVILLAAGSEVATNIYLAAQRLNLLGASWVWIVSEQASNVHNAPQGVLSWKASEQATFLESNMRDAMRVINQGMTTYLKNNTDLGKIPNGCGEVVLQSPETIPFWQSKDAAWWQPGIGLYELYQGVSIPDGETGYIRFNDEGDRQSVNYNFVNVLENGGENVVGQFTTVFNLSTTRVDNSLEVDVGSIIWPGNIDLKPDGVNVSKHLRVVTIQEIPFIYTEPYDLNKGCNNSQLNNPEAIAKMKCPKYLENGTVLEFCCYGYLIDMLDLIKINMSVTFDLHLVSDDNYGIQVPAALNSTGSGKSRWNGLMGELLGGDADMIVANFNINPERAKYVDFTKPFKFLGITILVKKKTLWFLVVVSVHVIALVLYLLDRFSPFGQLQLARESDSEDALSLSTAIWFAWGVLLNSGIGEGTPKSFSARVLGMVWAGFAMIIVASYTANLAAFLVLDKPEASISGIDDPRLRNPTENFKFATVKNSAIEEYFKRQVEFTTMYRTMENENKKTVKEAIEAVENGELNAFIWDSPRLIYEATKKCDLVTAGELFGRSSYGIAFKKNSHWTDKFSLKILSYHEVGKMEKYDNKWIMNASSTDCEQSASSPATLGLTNMAGVFIMVAAGIGIGFVILLIEIGYNKYENMKEKQNTIAKKAVARWKRYVQRRRALRKTWTLIRDINDTDSLNDEEHRQRIRAYLEASPSQNRLSLANINGIDLDVPIIVEPQANGVTKTSDELSQSNHRGLGPPPPPTRTTSQLSPQASSLPSYLYSDGGVKHNPVFDDNV